MNSVKRNFEELEIADKLVTFRNGQDVIDYIGEILKNECDEALRDGETTIQPITLLLLDINMPILDGFETLKKAKDLYRLANQRLN